MLSSITLTEFITNWYRWGVAIAFAATFVATLWIFFDSQSNGYKATLWRLLSLCAAIAVIPSVILSFSPYLAMGLPETLLNTLAVAGVVALGVALLSLIFYALGLAVVYPETEHLLDVNPLPPFAKQNHEDAPAASDQHQAGPSSVSTPPHGIPDITPTAVTPQRLPTSGNDTIRIKKHLDSEIMFSWIVVLSGPYQGREFRLKKITDIGREEEYNDVWLDDRTISRQHARIRYEEGVFVIYDLASANGVFVNGEQVQRQVLAHGDRIKLGQIMLGVLLVQDDVAILPQEVETVQDRFHT